MHGALDEVDGRSDETRIDSVMFLHKRRRFNYWSRIIFWCIGFGLAVPTLVWFILSGENSVEGVGGGGLAQLLLRIGVLFILVFLLVVSIPYQTYFAPIRVTKGCINIPYAQTFLAFQGEARIPLAMIRGVSSRRKRPGGSSYLFVFLEGGSVMKFDERLLRSNYEGGDGVGFVDWFMGVFGDSLQGERDQSSRLHSA